MQNDLISYDEHIEQGSIGRHETFTPRYGWLKKGYDAVKEDSAVFKASDAVERLGVGKNMVLSLIHISYLGAKVSCLPMLPCSICSS